MPPAPVWEAGIAGLGPPWLCHRRPRIGKAVTRFRPRPRFHNNFSIEFSELSNPMYANRTMDELLAMSRRLVEEGERLCRQLAETLARARSIFAEREIPKWPAVERRSKPRTGDYRRFS